MHNLQAVTELVPGGAGGGGGVTLSPSQASYGAGAAAGSFTVTASPGVSWVASASQSWITVTSSSNGSGSGTVSYSVLANSAAARSGAVVVNGVSHTINQAAGTAQQVQVSVSSSLSLVVPNDVVQLNAVVTGTANTGVTWSQSPNYGGVFTPASSNTPTFQVPAGLTDGTMQVTATSQADPTKSGSATLTRNRPPLPVNLDPQFGTAVGPIDFMFEFRDPDGYSTIDSVQALFWNQDVGNCHVRFHPLTKFVELFAGGGEGLIGSGTILQAPRCDISLAGSSEIVSADGQSLTLKLRITFKPDALDRVFAVEGRITDARNLEVYQPFGSWTVPKL